MECKNAARSMTVSATQASEQEVRGKTKKEKKEKWYERWCSGADCGVPSCGGRRGRGDTDGGGCDVGDCDIVPDCSW